MKKIIQVLLPVLQGKAIFDYYTSEELELGTIVQVSLRNKELEGVVWSKTKSNDKVPEDKIKSIIKSFPNALPVQTLKFIQFISEYNLIKLGAVLKLFFAFSHHHSASFQRKLGSVHSPSASCEPDTIHKDGSSCQAREKGLVPSFRWNDATMGDGNLPILNAEQQCALSSIREAASRAPVKPILLEGITGSGKTEVYMHAIHDALGQAGSQLLVLLPEIMLTEHLVERFKKSLMLEAHLWHSGVAKKDKKQLWRGVLDGSARLVIGARSALFLPFKNLKLIVIDEEHDQSYKQEDNLIYHARDMAVAYGHIAQIPIILSSATPSLETFYNVINGKYARAELASRYHDVSLPDISIINMKQAGQRQSKWLSDSLIDKVTKALAAGSQVILFLNRKGYAPITLCRVCEYKLECPNCSSFLVMYKGTKVELLCHHCGHLVPYPSSCPECDRVDSLVNAGPGVDRLFEEASKLWPDKIIRAVTRDIIQKDAESTSLLDEIITNKIDILIGTQVLSKGYHFPNLNLVGIIDADIGLSGADLKASERSYQLLTQVGGRAGRETKGAVLIQTYNPNNPLLTSLKTNNKQMFYNEELKARQMMNMPPFSRLVALIFSGKNKEKLEETIKNFASHMPYIDNIEVLGPAPAPLAKIRKSYRYRFLIKASPKINLQKYIQLCLEKAKIPSSIRLKIDIDPCSFL